MLRLVTDRTLEHVANASIIAKTPLKDLTQQQKLEWEKDALNSDLAKGRYDETDMNRVANAISELKEELKKNGYYCDVQPYGAWVKNNIPTEAQMTKHIQDVKKIQTVFVGMKTPLPDTMNVDHIEANNIEKSLLEIEERLINIRNYSPKLNDFNFYSGLMPL